MLFNLAPCLLSWSLCPPPPPPPPATDCTTAYSSSTACRNPCLQTPCSGVTRLRTICAALKLSSHCLALLALHPSSLYCHLFINRHIVWKQESMLHHTVHKICPGPNLERQPRLPLPHLRPSPRQGRGLYNLSPLPLNSIASRHPNWMHGSKCTAAA